MVFSREVNAVNSDQYDKSSADEISASQQDPCRILQDC